jgi:hypothetical protein
MENSFADWTSNDQVAMPGVPFFVEAADPAVGQGDGL